jgi:hypothetical protein
MAFVAIIAVVLLITLGAKSYIDHLNRADLVARFQVLNSIINALNQKIKLYESHFDKAEAEVGVKEAYAVTQAEAKPIEAEAQLVKAAAKVVATSVENAVQKPSATTVTATITTFETAAAPVITAAEPILEAYKPVVQDLEKVV